MIGARSVLARIAGETKGWPIMSDSANAFGLALLATLEAKAKKNGEKSVVKGVLRRLKAAGASDQLIGEVAALCGKKAKPAKSDVTAKGSSESKGASKSKGAAKAKKKPGAVALHA